MAKKAITLKDMENFIDKRVEERLKHIESLVKEKDEIIKQLNEDCRKLQRSANDVSIKFKDLKINVDLLELSMKNPKASGRRGLPVNKAVQVNCESCQHFIRDTKVSPIEVDIKSECEEKEDSNDINGECDDEIMILDTLTIE